MRTIGGRRELVVNRKTPLQGLKSGVFLFGAGRGLRGGALIVAIF